MFNRLGVLITLVAVMVMSQTVFSKDGSMGNGEAILTAIRSQGDKVSPRAEYIILSDAFETGGDASVISESELAAATTKELTGKCSATLAEILSAVIKRGGGLCAPKDGPWLRLNLPNQEPGDWRIVVMHPIACPDGSECVFYVGNDGDDKLLIAGDGDDGQVWYGNRTWVYRRTTKFGS